MHTYTQHTTGKSKGRERRGALGGERKSGVHGGGEEEMPVYFDPNQSLGFSANIITSLYGHHHIRCKWLLHYTVFIAPSPNSLAHQ